MRPVRSLISAQLTSVPQAQEGSYGALVCTFGQHDSVSFEKFAMLLDNDHVRAPFRHFIYVAALLRSKPRLVDKPRLFQFGIGGFLFAGRARRLPLRRFLLIQPFGF